MKNTLITFISLGLIVGAFIAGYFIAKPASCGAACENMIVTVTPEEFNKQTSDKLVEIIDVRRPDEYASGHVKGAVNADVSDPTSFNQFLDTLDKDKKYLVYCRSGVRSEKAMNLMKEKGFTKITNLAGGLIAWQSSGFPISSE